MTRETPEVRSDKGKPGWTLFEHHSASISINKKQSCLQILNHNEPSLHSWCTVDALMICWCTYAHLNVNTASLTQFIVPLDCILTNPLQSTPDFFWIRPDKYQFATLTPLLHFLLGIIFWLSDVCRVIDNSKSITLLRHIFNLFWNCQWPVARWLPRGGVRWGKPHQISNFNCWGFPQPAQLPHPVTGRGRGGIELSVPDIYE